MSGSPPPRSSQLPTSPSGYSRPRRTRKPPDRFGVYETPDLVLSSEEDEDPDLTLVQLSPVRLSASSASPRLPTNSVTCSIRLPTPPGLMMSPVRPYRLSFTPSPMATPGPSRPAFILSSPRPGSSRPAFILSPPRPGPSRPAFILSPPRRQVWGNRELVQSDSDDSDNEIGPGIETGRTIRRRVRPPVSPSDEGQGHGVHAGILPPVQDQESTPVLQVQDGGDQQQDGADQQSPQQGDQQQAPAQPGRIPHPVPHHPQPGREERVGQGIDGRVDLTPWLNPVVPGPSVGPLPDDGDGWNRIDLLGVWECGLSTFRALEEVPSSFREKWAKVMSTILSRLQQATTLEEETRALKWFLIAPQALLREPKRGGKKGQIFSALNARFDCISRGDFGTILALLDSDRTAARQRRTRGRREQREEDVTTARAKLRKTVLSLLKRGQVSRAVRRICSHGIASMDDPQVQAALQAKYTARGRDLPASVTRGQCVDRILCSS